MKRIQSNRLESAGGADVVYRGGGGCIAVFGLPFLGAGIAAMVSAAMGWGKGEVWVAWIVGPIFALVGAAFVFGRSGMEIDTRAGTYERWFWCLVTLRRRGGSLDAFGRVTLSEEVRRSDKSTYVVYPVRLEGEAGAKLDIQEDRDQMKALAEAEFLAKTLHLPLADRTGQTEVVREPEQLDESLRDRRERLGADEPLPDAPADMRSSVHTEGDRICFEIPPPGVKQPAALGGLAMAIIVPAFVVAVFLLPLLGEKGMPAGMKLIFAGFLGVFFILMPMCVGLGGVLRLATRRAQVEVSPKGLEVTHRWALGAKTERIPADELEELMIQRTGLDSHKIKLKGQAVVARSDQTRIEFGAHLPDDEKQYIRAVIEQVVTA